MSRQGSYRDANADAYSESQRMSNFPGRVDSFPPEQGNPFVSSRWERDPRRTPQSRPYSEARHVSEPRLDLEKEANKRPRYQTQEQDMEIGYEDKPSLLTFEILEQKFQGEILKLLKEQSDAEDAEIVRHRERIVDINTQYQEKLVILRARQFNRREEFLRKESERRLEEYQQAGQNNSYIPKVSNDLHSPRRADYEAGVALEGRRAYESLSKEDHRGYIGQKINYESHFRGYSNMRGDYEREPPGSYYGTEERVPMPAGRVYNNHRARYG